MEKKAVSLIVLSILIVNLFSFASSPPGNPYTIWIHVELSGSPVSGATVKVKENATGEVGYAEDYGEGWYGINLGNFKNGWKYGDEVFIEAFYQQFYGSNSTILTNEGYSFVNISLKPNSLPSIYLVSPANNSTNVSINPILKVHVVDVDSNIMSVKFYGRKLGNLTWQLLGINTNVANNSNTSITWYNLEYGTTYEWYAVANDSITENSSDIWRFTTQAVPPVNNPPVANDDYYSTDEDIMLVAIAPGVLENDYDADGDALSAILVSEPSHGSLTFNSNGSFIYTPQENYYGQDSFTYKAYDGKDYSNIATIYINITAVNDAPFAVDDIATTDEDIPIYINLTSNDYDIDGSIDLTSIEITQNPSHGSLNVYSNGTVLYTPDANYYGSDSFKYKVKDNSNAWSNEACVNITINSINDAPIANFTYEPLHPLINQTIYFNSTSYDLDGSIVNFTWSFGDGSIGYGERINHSYIIAGNYIVNLTVRDNEGAVSGITKEIIIWLQDINPPFTAIELGLPYYYDGNHWISSSTEIWLNATDEGVGVNITYYKIDDGDWIEYTTPFTISGEGEHTIYYYSIDNLGNEEERKSIIVKVDNTPPEIFIQSEFFVITPANLICFADDYESGLQSVSFYYQYSYDNKTWSEEQFKCIDYSEPYSCSFDEIGFYRISAIAMDNVNNSKDFEIFVRIFNPDFNSDGTINVQDLVIIAKNFNGTDAKYDIDGDGMIDLKDARLVLEFWHREEG